MELRKTLLVSAGHGPPAIRKDYWDAMCDQWATQEHQARSTIATQNRAKMPEASLHTSGSITFGCHKKRMEEETGGPVAYTELFRRTHKRKESGEFVSQRAKEVVESYEQQLIERHGDDSSQHPQFDASAWLVATGQLKKGRVFGFGIGMDAGGVISSTMESGCSAASYSYTQSPPPLQQPTELPDHYYSAFIKQLDNWFDQTVAPTLYAMGVAFPHPPPPPSTAIGEQSSSDVDGDDHETHFAED
ncbi:hypothetical protein Taro_029222 [Colocasia esculenta]|uniref:Uncharacterized protein n=1 Tax=Colocasia esculenta TaxID=4460 RepID=A0A843VKQ8_COLES|nr:hypothetical protein [Colocasia esculenta]